MELDREKILRVLNKYIAEDKPYLFYEEGMYPNFVNRETLIKRITDELIKDDIVCECKNECSCKK